MTYETKTPSSPDVTTRLRIPGPGVPKRRMCFTCNTPTNDTGGRLNKRTRMWSCASCVSLQKHVD